MSQLAALAAIDGTHELGQPPDIYQVFADFCTAPLGDVRASWLLGAGLVSSDKIATDMFLAKSADVRLKWRDIKDWGYLKAVEFVGARKSEQRKRSLVESYRIDWGHQAARDGLATAIYGEEADIPGIRARSLQFHCGQQAYQRVRDEVGSKANDLINEAAHWLEMCRSGKFSPEYKDRWELATGAKWCGNS